MIRLIDERIMEKLRDKPENIDLEEFVPLVVEWREEKALMANCPYCVKPIEKQATKCNHCLSELEWFKFDGLYGPCKAGASEEMEAALVMARATFHAAVEAEKAAAEKKIKAAKEKIKLAVKLAELSKSRCTIARSRKVDAIGIIVFIAIILFVFFSDLVRISLKERNRPTIKGELLIQSYLLPTQPLIPHHLAIHPDSIVWLSQFASCRSSRSSFDSG